MIKLYKQLFEYAGRYRYLTVSSMVLSGVSAVAGLVPFVCIWFVLNAELQAMPEFENAIDAGRYGWYAFYFAIASMLIYIGALMCSHLAAFRVIRNLRSKMLQHVLNIPDGKLFMQGTGKVRRTIEQCSAATEAFLAHQTPDYIGAVITPIAILILLFVFDYRLGIASIVPVILAFMVMSTMTGKDMHKKMSEYHNELESISNEMVEYVRGVAVIKTFGQTAMSFGRLKKAIDRFRLWVTQYSDSMRTPMIIFTLFVHGIFAFLIGAAWMITGGTQADPGFLADFLFYVVFTPVIPVTLMKILFMGENQLLVRESLERIEGILSIGVLSEPAEGRVPSEYIIEIDKVSFHYNDDSHAALDEVSLTVGQGQTVALVGASGSGKSTLAALIARAWDPCSGSIRIGGIDLRDIAKTDRVRIISTVFQDAKLLRRSILDNVRLGKKDATRAEVLAALHYAQCDDILEKLPDGVDTMYGSKGVYLSGGECQRIALARVILSDTPVVILDEATAFADPENEYLMLKAFEYLAKNKTVIKIAHRLTTVQNADCIYVMAEGKIAESGTHDELISHGTIYPELWKQYQMSINWHI
ncbi:MAG: ABC transporter ATP-binding protein [Proteobacteria bacterium]|nr:ABC transporter ATP-binding protein [Pseudomonadota bacterium]